MRLKTQTTIDEDIVRAREARDLAILNKAADALDREMDDVLVYQADVCARAAAGSPPKSASASKKARSNSVQNG